MPVLATFDDMIYEVMQSEKSKKELEQAHHAQGKNLECYNDLSINANHRS